MNTTPSKLLIGWSEADTTPAGKVDLSGQYYHRIADGVHSRLSATALVFESDNAEAVVMVSLELVGFQADFQEAVRAKLRAELPDLDAAKVFLNVTHTHNAPGVDLICGIGWLAELPEVLPAAEYRKFMLDKIVAVVSDAWRNRRPGGVASGLASARVGHCRRAVYSDGTAEMYGCTGREDFIGMEGGEDSGVDLL
ncbi:MAG: neutral/alkaline non-lysosomal ceramidase N-terminal domain-containing protein, partial [bacterium]